MNYLRLLQELQQHDVQELNRILFSAIEDSLVGTSGQNLISQFYHGNIVNQVRILCQKILDEWSILLQLSPK